VRLPRQVLLLGIEAHVCVLQTTMDLLDKGMEVHLLLDGISSQREHDRAVAIQRMAAAGARGIEWAEHGCRQVPSRGVDVGWHSPGQGEPHPVCAACVATG